VIDESPRCSPHVSRLEEAERSSPLSSQDPLASDRLLAHISGHLADVQRLPSGAGSTHDDPAVIHLEVLVSYLPRNISSPGELVHDVYLKRFFHSLAGKTFQRTLPVVVDVLVNLLLSLGYGPRDLLLDRCGCLQLVHRVCESAEEHEPVQEPRNRVQESASLFGSIVLDYTVEQALGLFCSYRGLVDDALFEDPILDYDERVEGAVVQYSPVAVLALVVAGKIRL